MRVAYAGEPGAFGEQAALALAAEVEAVQVASFAAVVEAVVGGTATLGVVPVENAIAGPVVEGIAAVVERAPAVRGEVRVHVQHLLLGVEGARLEEVREVTSHPQALAQCARFIAARGWRTVAEVNTAVAARRVSEAGRVELAAIASVAAGRRLGLQVLAEGIADAEGNVTRFLVVGAKTRQPADQPTQSISLFVAPAGDARAPARAIGRAGAQELVELAGVQEPPSSWKFLGCFARAAQPANGSATASV